MKVYQTNEIKNIALIGSAGSGKTTLAEALLYGSGIIKRRGTVEQKNTVSDYFPVEQEYGYSVFPTVFHVEWNNKKLNFIDCPGSDDFVGGAVTALNVCDQALLLVNGTYGPEVGTMNAFRNTEKLQKPVIFLVNQLDKDNCDHEIIVNNLKETYGAKCLPVQFPVATGPAFNAVIDVLTMKKYSWKPEGGMPIVENIPAARMERLAEHLGVTPAYLMGWSTAAPTAQAKALMDVFEQLDAEDQQKLNDFAAELTANAAKTVSNDSLAVPAQLRAG